MDGAAPQFEGQGRGPFVGAVGDQDAARAAAEEGARGFFAGLARADDQDGVVGQGTENFFGQLNGDGTDGDAAALDVGFGADLFGDVEGFLENSVQAAAGVLVLEGRVVGFFQLAEDFRFAQDHGIQAAGDLEKVLQAAGVRRGSRFRRPAAPAIGGSQAKIGGGGRRLPVPAAPSRHRFPRGCRWRG